MEIHWLYAYLAVGVVLFMGFCRWIAKNTPGDDFVGVVILLLWPLAIPCALVVEFIFLLKKIAKIGVKK